MERKGLSASLAQIATTVANVLAERRGIPMIVGFFLVLLNFVFQFIPALGWTAEHNALPHLGVLLAIGGSLLSSAL